MTIPAADYILDLVRRKRNLFARFALSSLARAGLTMATVALIEQFLAGILGGRAGLATTLTATLGTAAALWSVAGLLLACYVATSLANYASQVLEQRIIRTIELGVMDRLVRHLLTLSVGFIDRQSHGDLIQAMRQDVAQLRSVLSALVRIVLDGLLAAGLLATAVWISPRLAFWVLFAFPVVAVPIVLVARSTVRRSFHVRLRISVLYDAILEILRGIRVIKLYRGEEAAAGRAAKRARKYFETALRIARTEALAHVFLESVAGLSVVVVVIAGGFQVLSGELSWPSLLSFLVAVRAAQGPLHAVNGSYLEVQRHRASVIRIGQLLDERPTVADAPDALPMSSAPRRIGFESVSFVYETAAVLDGVSFEISAGETLGIAGPSGSGKTTLLHLVARLFDPTSGTVCFDGVDVRRYPIADVYRHIALVPQEPFLFSSSVRDNIRCGRPDATDVEVEAAARACEVHDEILQFPDGYDTVLGTGGRAVSEGQAQRINIARALLKNAPVLLLDEATSSLDSVSEAKVQCAIESLVRGRTTFVVAHRLSTLRSADRILVLDRGRPAGLGTHDELISGCDLYRRMWEPQSSAGWQEVNRASLSRP